MSLSMSVLFTGYAPVHFLCFEPLYRRLRESSDFEVFLSGGLFCLPVIMVFQANWKSVTRA